MPRSARVLMRDLVADRDGARGNSPVNGRYRARSWSENWPERNPHKKAAIAMQRLRNTIPDQARYITTYRFCSTGALLGFFHSGS